MTTRRFRIVHATSFVYTGPVSSSHNEVRMTPLTEEGQATLESRLRIRPLTWSHVYRDYWGTHTTAIEASGVHERLEIEAVSTVERYTVPAPDAARATWEDLASARVRDRSFEWLDQRSKTLLPDDVLAGFVDATAGTSPVDAVTLVVGRIHDHMDYESGHTVATSRAAEAWVAGKGVCQDFVHATLGALRHLGIPSRYVSGYLAPDPDAPIGQALSAESHAWVEWWDGAWHGIDPTNRRDVGLDHVTVARGRDYEDVAPFKGVYLGDEEAELSVDVTITRLS